MARPNYERCSLVFLVGLFLILQFVASFRLNINWDEYYFLSHIYAFSEGRLTQALQTFHVELLGWIIWIPGSEADQIVAGRLFMMLCEVGALFCVFRIAANLTSKDNALFAVAAWCSAGHALLHGASFRADPLAAFMMMAALALLITGKPNWGKSVAAGVLAAIGLLVTLKSAFFLAPFLAAFLWRWSDSSQKAKTLLNFGSAGLALLISLAVLWAIHGANIAQIAPVAAERAAVAPSTFSQGKGIFDKVLLSQQLFPQSAYLFQWMTLSVFSIGLCLLGVWGSVRSPEHSARTIGPLAAIMLFLPIFTVVIYRNAFPYFFPFILLPVAITAAFGAERITKPSLRLAIIFAMILGFTAQFGKSWEHDQSTQRIVAEAAHVMFPEPVPYVDRNGMLPSFPKAGFFMSTWGSEGYLAGQGEGLNETISRLHPPLLLLNSPLLEEAVMPDRRTSGVSLRSEDISFIQSNYIAHWGPIWVAGKNLNGESGVIKISIPGKYTIECNGKRILKGEVLQCNSTVLLAAGIHEWSGGSSVLRWGERLTIPNVTPPVKPIYYGF